MYAVFADSGKQYKVAAGDVVEVDLRELADGATQVEFNDVLLVGSLGGSGGEVKIGQPLVAGAKVVGKLLQHEDENGETTPIFKGPKLIIYTYRRRKGHEKKRGHRAKMLRVEIAEIVG